RGEAARIQTATARTDRREPRILIMSSRLERLQQRALTDPALAAWFAGWKRDRPVPTLDDALRAVEWFADALDSRKASELRAEQLRPFNVTMLCESSECSLVRALKRKPAEPPAA